MRLTRTETNMAYHAASSTNYGTYFLSEDALFIPLEDIEDNVKKLFGIFSMHINLNIKIRAGEMIYDISKGEYAS